LNAIYPLDGKIVEKKEECGLDGKVRNKTILVNGMLAGKLKRQQGVDKMNHCIERCCKEKRCSNHLNIFATNIPWKCFISCKSA